MVLVIILMLYHVFRGPSVYDRLNGLMVIGTDTIFYYYYSAISTTVEMFAVFYCLYFRIFSFVVLLSFWEKGDLGFEFIGAILQYWFLYIGIAALGVLRFQFLLLTSCFWRSRDLRDVFVSFRPNFN